MTPTANPAHHLPARPHKRGIISSAAKDLSILPSKKVVLSTEAKRSGETPASAHWSEPVAQAVTVKTPASAHSSEPSHQSATVKTLFLRLSLTLALVVTLPALSQTPHFNGPAAFALTQQYVSAAPHRYVNSPDHLKAEAFIKSHFAPEAAKGNFETDAFTASTPIGQVAMRNYIVRYPGKGEKKDGIIVLATHYETNYWLKDIDFVGANDGASTTALLIQIGAYLRTHPPQGYSIYLLFDDGEESINATWSDRDSLYGTRHLAAKWSQNGTLAKIKAFLLADMIADKDLNIDHDENSTPWLLDMLTVAARNTGHSASIFKNETQVLDDHLPFKQRGVPVLDIIDLDYGPHTPQAPEGYHHTAQDTMDKISARSLQIAGDLFLEMIRLIDLR